MLYPPATHPEDVGTYAKSAYKGGGYFFDAVLEYRVWYHNDAQANDMNDHDTYDNDLNDGHYQAFATFEAAQAFADDHDRCAPPLALVQQLEWLDEPARGVYIHNKGERFTEWHPEWLTRGARKPEDIAQFLQKKAKMK